MRHTLDAMSRKTIAVALSTLAFALVLLALSRTAAAQPGHPMPGTGAGTELASHWYGYQILGADAVLLLGAAITERSEPLVGMAFSGAAIHLLHRNPWRAIGSVVIRVGMTTPGLWLESRYPCAEEDEGCLTYAFLAVAGGAAAIAIDVALLGRERVEVPRRPFLIPTAALGRGGNVRVGVAGRF